MFKWKHNGVYCDYELVMSKAIISNIFKNKEKSLKINGLKCYDKVECYQSLFEHELIHLVAQLYCEEKVRRMGGHTQTFKNIVYNLFRHTHYKHMLLSGDVDEMEKRIEDIKSKAEIGDWVETTKKGHCGYVVKMTDKSIYLKLKDGRVFYYNYAMATKLRKTKGKERKEILEELKKKDKGIDDIKNKLKVGQTVYVKLKSTVKSAIVVRLRSKTALIELEEDGSKWNFPYNLIDI